MTRHARTSQANVGFAREVSCVRAGARLLVRLVAVACVVAAAASVQAQDPSIASRTGTASSFPKPSGGILGTLSKFDAAAYQARSSPQKPETKAPVD